MPHGGSRTSPCAHPSLDAVGLTEEGRCEGRTSFGPPVEGKKREEMSRIPLKFSPARENFWRSKDKFLEGLRPALRRHANNPMVPWPCIPGEEVRRGAGRSLPAYSCGAKIVCRSCIFAKCMPIFSTPIPESMEGLLLSRDIGDGRCRKQIHQKDEKRIGLNDPESGRMLWPFSAVCPGGLAEIDGK